MKHLSMALIAVFVVSLEAQATKFAQNFQDAKSASRHYPEKCKDFNGNWEGTCSSPGWTGEGRFQVQQSGCSFFLLTGAKFVESMNTHGFNVEYGESHFQNGTRFSSKWERHHQWSPEGTVLGTHSKYTSYQYKDDTDADGELFQELYQERGIWLDGKNQLNINVMGSNGWVYDCTLTKQVE